MKEIIWELHLGALPPLCWYLTIFKLYSTENNITIKLIVMLFSVRLEFQNI